MKYVGLGCVATMILTVAKAALPNVFYFLPLGGSSITELGIVLGMSVAAAKLKEIFAVKND